MFIFHAAKLQKSACVITILFNINSIEVLNKFIEFGDDLLKFDVEDIERLREMKEKEEESTASKLIGRIGEELAMKWLEWKNLNPEYVAETTKEYDIFVPNDEKETPQYIDVKTTIKSVIENDASVPLHIHKYAMWFLEAETDRNYYIVRISLGDLDIANWNSELKDKHNFKGEDRKLTEATIDDIQIRVNEFWDNSENRSLFDEKVKKFKLTIPKFE